MTHFDERARTWDADPMKWERAKIVAQGIRDAIPLHPSMRALEFGCGTGLLSFALQKDFAEITLADTSAGMLEVLTEKIRAAGAAHLHPVLIAPDADPFSAAQFDIVYSLMTLHHISDTAAALKRFQALLAPNGWLCIADLDAEDGSFHGVDAADIHRGFDRELLRQKVESAGFSQVRFTTIFTVPRQGRDYPVFLLTALKK